MKKILSSLITISLFFLIIEISQTGCANIIPPGGGPRDSLPPVLVNANPKDSSLNTAPTKITLSFNEYIELKDVTQNLIVSPLPKNSPIIEHKLKTITIKLKDSLEANTTYSLNFGNSIVDINENNPLRNFTYIFSTGNKIDNNSLSGKIMVAETGLTDSTLIAVLYKNLNDTAVIKERPRYMAKLNGNGIFSFNNLPAGNYNLFAMTNSYTKKYDDSTQLFGFLDSVIEVGKSTTASTIFTFQEAKKIAPTPPSTVKPDTDKNLKYTTSLENGRQDILDSALSFTFSRKIKSIDTNKIFLYDTNYKKLSNYKIVQDSNKLIMRLIADWKPQTPYYLILQRDAVLDTINAKIAKSDTLKFTTKSEKDYGTVKIRFNKIDTNAHKVLLIYKESKLYESIKITQREIVKKLYQPGEYELKILIDKNNNGIWDTGNYKQKRQPEIIQLVDKKLSVRANWDNETDIVL